MKGLFLVLEGGDGSGKSSQLELLEEFFKKGGQHVHTIHFPRLNVKPYGEIIAEYLRGELGKLDTVHPKLAALLYALDRQQAAAGLREIIDGGITILADRYLLSNIAYQCARTPNAEERRKLEDWIEIFEYGVNDIPRPDLTLYLDVPMDFAAANLAQARVGADRDYLKGGRDIHEENLSFQERVRDEFLRLAKARSGELGVVDCRGPGGGIADRQTIHSRIIDSLRYFGVIAR